MVELQRPFHQNNSGFHSTNGSFSIGKPCYLRLDNEGGNLVRIEACTDRRDLDSHGFPVWEFHGISLNQAGSNLDRSASTTHVKVICFHHGILIQFLYAKEASRLSLGPAQPSSVIGFSRSIWWQDVFFHSTATILIVCPQLYVY